MAFDPAEWNEYRARMNERILSEDNLSLKRFFAVDHDVYEAGALDAKTKELMGLVLVRYTAWKLRDLELSPRKMFEKLEGIRVSLVQDNGTREASFVVEQMDGVQSTMFARLGLDRYIIK